MNPEYRAKWVARLRSGKDAQGRFTLRNEDGAYCCMGILCEIVTGTELPVRSRANSDAYGNMPSNSYIPCREAGLTPEDLMACATWNDEDGLSFPEIADKVEAKF